MDSGLSEVFLRAGRTRSEIARRAGVNRSTMYRASEGTVDVRLDTLTELALASGVEPIITYRPLSDPAAADAGRVLMEGAAELGEMPAATAAWVARIERFAQPATLGSIAAEAGLAASLLHRADALGVSGTFTAAVLDACGAVAGGEWALSGAAALAALGADAAELSAAVQILWTPDPGRALQHLVGLGGTVANPAAASVILCAPGELTLQGSASRDGVRVVAPAQAIIDNLGLVDPQRSAAARLVASWG